MLNASGQSVSQNQYKFTNYDFRHGLPITHIKAIAQDSLGFIWLGSSNGIARFDGYTFKHFVADDQDSTSLSGNDIAVIKVAPDGKIWVGTHDNGISVWDYNADRFSKYTFNPDDPVEILTGAITDFHFWNSGDVWVCGARIGIYNFSSTGKWEKVETGELMLPVINSFLSDPADSSSIYFGNRQLFHYDGKNRLFKKMMTGHSGWAGLLADPSGRIWGKRYHDIINVLNPINGVTEQIVLGKLKRVSRFAISGNQVWVGSMDGGIYTIDMSTLEVTSVELSPFDPWSLPSDIARSVFKSKSDMIWIGTSAGVSLLDPGDQYFRNIKLKAPGQSSYIEPHAVLPFHEENKHLIAPYYFKEILLYNLDTKSYQIIPKANDSDVLHAPIKIWEIDGTYWILYSNGMGYLDESNMQIKKMDVDAPGNTFGKSIIIDADIDANEDLWIVDVAKNVYRVNVDAGVMDTFYIPFEDKMQGPRSIAAHASGIWMGMGSNIVHLDPKTNVKKYFPHSSYPQHRTGNNDIYIDSENHLWVATYRDVLHKYQMMEDTLVLMKSYDLTDGLAGKSSGEIDGDDEGNVFVSSSSGFSVYDRKNDRFRSYNTINGLISNRLNGISAYEGQIFITTHSGYSFVDSEKLQTKEAAPEVIFTDVRVGDSKIKHIHSASKGSLSYKHDQNDFSVEYVGIHFEDPLKVRYRHRLLPDTNWIQTGAETRSVRYPNLKSGSYTFEIQASLDDVHWGSVSTFPFRIIAPFWEKMWFRLILLVLLGTSVYFFMKWREKQIKSSEQMRTQMAELELKALRSQMNPHFMFNSLNSIKNYILKSKPADAAQYLSSFAHLIRMTLQNSREKTISLSQELETLMLYIDLEKLRFKKGFEFTCEVDEQLNLDDIEIPPLLLQPYVENAIWHGLMHKQDDAVLSLGFQKMDGSIECVIEDNGVGREKAALLKSSSARKYKSMGMGITKDRIDILNQINALGIEVSVIDKKDESGYAIGTKVMIQIPGVQKDQKV